MKNTHCLEKLLSVMCQVYDTFLGAGRGPELMPQIAATLQQQVASLRKGVRCIPWPRSCSSS